MAAFQVLEAPYWMNSFKIARTSDFSLQLFRRRRIPEQGLTGGATGGGETNGDTFPQFWNLPRLQAF